MKQDVMEDLQGMQRGLHMSALLRGLANFTFASMLCSNALKQLKRKTLLCAMKRMYFTLLF